MEQPLNSRTIAFWFSITCVLTACIGLIAYWETHQLVGSFDSVSASHLTLEKLQTIEVMMEAAESSVDAYVITGRGDRLQGYLKARAAVPSLLKKVEIIVSGYPRQKATLRRLKESLTTHL